MEPAADSTARADPGQKNFEGEIGQTSFHVFFSIHFRSNRIPFQTRLYL